jgi:hypothetical protein
MNNKIYLLLLIGCIWIFDAIGQQILPVKDIEQKTINVIDDYYRELTFASSHLTNRRYRWADVKPLFTDNAQIEVQSTRRNRPIIRTAQAYFDRISLLSPHTYDSLTFSARKNIQVRANKASCVENVLCAIEAEVRQEFKGWKNGRIIYQDCTIKVITVIFTRNRGRLTAKIDYIKAETTNNGC